MKFFWLMVFIFFLGYMVYGIFVRDFKKLYWNYMLKVIFKIDCFLIFLLDFFYFVGGINMVVLRLLCLFWLYCFLELRSIIEICFCFLDFLFFCFLVVMVLFIFYWNVCFYFVFLRWIGFGLDDWVYLKFIKLGFDFLVW